jgi:hypothetical protein
MNLQLLSCHRREHPKINVASRKSVKKKSKSKRKHKKSSSHSRRRIKSSYLSSNLFSKNFYPANFFFQNDDHQRLFESSHSHRVGVNDQNGFLITQRNRNPPQLPPQLPRKNFLPSSRMLLQQHYMKVGFLHISDNEEE